MKMYVLYEVCNYYGNDSTLEIVDIAFSETDAKDLCNQNIG